MAVRTIGRRALLCGTAGASLAMTAAHADDKRTIALLHLAPRAGDLDGNRHMIETAVLRAAELGATLIVTPELCVSGYGFRDLIGTGWIAARQAAQRDWLAQLARRASATLVVGQPEADGNSLFNCLVVVAQDGSTIGRHRKIAVLRVGAESWSTAGDRPTVLDIPEIGRVGLFVCADMHSQRLVRETARQGCDLLLSGAAWAPGEHGPSGEWEWASREADRPVLVCNRTGHDVLDFNGACSIAAIGGTIVFAHDMPQATIVLVDWMAGRHQLAAWRAVLLES